ncbi:MFS transporter [soil metagenome]
MVAILAFTGILGALMQTMVIPIISELPDLLNTSPSNASWVVTATLLSAAITTPISGRLGDMFGKRRVLLICISILAVGCVICAMTSYLPLFILGRALQGTAMSVIPLGISILRDELRPIRVPTAIALISATLGGGASIGFPLSAFMAQHFNFHIVFWAAAVISVILMLLVYNFVPESPIRNPARFDFLGAFGLGAGLLCLLLPITKGSTWGWTDPEVPGLFAIGLIIIVFWVRYESRIAHPVVQIRTSASKPVLLTNITAVLVGFAMFTNNLVLPQLLQAPVGTGYGLGKSMVITGLCLAPGGFVMMLVSPLAGRISTRHGGKTTLICGLVMIVLTYSVASLFMDHLWELVIVSSLNGAGIGLSYAAMPNLIMASVPITESAAANGLNALMRSIGTSTSSAVMAMILTSMTTTYALQSVPAERAFHYCFGLAAIVGLVALVVATFIPPRRIGDAD